MRFSKETIENAYEKLSGDIKELLSSPQVADSISQVGEESDLHIDQIGSLFEETTYLLLGLQSDIEYKSNLERALGKRGAEINEIVSKLNDVVFLPIRSKMMEKSTPSEEKPLASTDLNREQVLSEIENPTPTIHPFSTANQTIPGPAKPREVIEQASAAIPQTPQAPQIPQTPPLGVQQAPIPQAPKTDVTHDFIEGKLTETVNLPSQKASTTPDALAAKPEEKPRRYAVDPYREPLE